MTTDPSLAEAKPAAAAGSDKRPPFLVRLGLLLPCSPDDVEAAYRARAKSAHPDGGGSASEFKQLQADYEAAREFAHYHSGRRGWLAANIEHYAAQQETIAEIEKRGGVVETRRPEWIAQEIGADFAQVLDKIVAVRMTGPKIGLDDIRYLVSQREALSNLHSLDLSDTQVDNRAVRLLTSLPTLHELNLSGTFAGNRTAAVLAELSGLRRVNLADTFVSWPARLTLRRRRPDLQISMSRDRSAAPSASKRAYRWVFRLLILYMVAIFVATHLPNIEPRLPKLRTWFELDKVVHFTMYFGFTILLAFVLALRKTDRAMRTGLSLFGYLAIGIFVGLFAAADETTQPLTGRELDVKDWMADMTGMASALLIFSTIQFFRHRGRSKAPVAATVLPSGIH